MFAVFEEALVTLTRFKRVDYFPHHYQYQEAKRWLRSERRDSPFDFAVICDAFNWNTSWMRRKILEALETKAFRGHEFSRHSRFSPRLGSNFWVDKRKRNRVRNREAVPVSERDGVGQGPLREQAVV